MVENVSIWTALADSKRRQIISLLAEQPRTTNNLTEFFDVSRFAIMKHLKVLEQANLIEVKREGRNRWNILNETLEHTLRTTLSNEDKPYRLIDILNLFPEQDSQKTWKSTLDESLPIEQIVMLQASPSEVFRILTECINFWWQQRLSTDSQIVLEPFLNGRLYETFGIKDQGILYGTVTYIKQDEELRLEGTTELAEQFTNTLLTDHFIRINLKPQNGSTQLTLRHYTIGLVDHTIRDICTHHWHNLLNQHLKPFVEKGVPCQHDP